MPGPICVRAAFDPNHAPSEFFHRARAWARDYKIPPTATHTRVRPAMDKVSFRVPLCDLLGSGSMQRDECPADVVVYGLELSTKLHIPCSMQPDRTIVGTLPRDRVVAIVAKAQNAAPCLASGYALEGMATALRALFAPDTLFVLLRHTPGKNMRVGVVCLACASNGDLTVRAVWNGNTLEHSHLTAPRVLQPLVVAIDTRFRHAEQVDFWEVGGNLDDAVSEHIWGNCAEFHLNAYTYCTLVPWLYLTVGEAQVLLERHTVPRAFAVAYVRLACAVAAACMAGFSVPDRMGRFIASQGTQPNAARPQESGEEHALGLFAKLAACGACPGPAGPAGRGVGGVAQAMTHMDVVLALLNKLLIDIDGRGKVYRSDNGGEDMSLVVSQHAYMGTFDAATQPYFAMRDCEDCAQVFTQVCNTEAAHLSALLAQLWPGLGMRVHLVRVVYLQVSPCRLKILTCSTPPCSHPGVGVR